MRWKLWGNKGTMNIEQISDGGHGTDQSDSRANACSNFSFKELIFILVVLATEIGCNISLDTPGALQNAIIKNYKLTAYQFSLLYSLYYIPTIVLNGFSGFLIDRIMGIKLSTLVYSLIGILGVALFAIGGVNSIFWLMLMGRLIFGLGNELATGVCVNYCIFAWYRNTIMNLVASLSSDGSIGGTLVVYQVAPRLYSYLQQFMAEKQALDIVFCLTSGLFLVTAAFAVLMTYLKPKEQVRVIVNAETELTSASLNAPEERTATFRDIVSFPAVFWLLCILTSLNSTFNSFSQFSQGLLTSEDFQLSVEQASDALTAMGAVKIALSIPLSLSVDILGRNTWYVLIAQALGALAYFFFTLKLNPFAGMVLVGLSQSIYNSAIMPMYAYPLEKHLIGSCYGIMSVFGGLSMFLSSLFVGKIIDNFGYMAAIYFYFTSSSLCLLTIIAIWILDKRSTGILNMTPKQRIEFEQRLETSRILTDQESTSNFTSFTNVTQNLIT